MTLSFDGHQTISLRANLKAMRIRPAREPGDKPVFEILLRTEVDPTTIALASRAGKDMAVHLVPDPELQPGLPLDVPAGDLDESLPVSGGDEDPEARVDGTVLPSNGRRRRGTRSSEMAPAPVTAD